jgi:hypothetical protein
LSLQLCVQEWLATFDAIAALEVSELYLLTDAVQKLLLFSLDSPFSVKPGTLDKLCFYLHKLLESSVILSPIESLLNQMEEYLLALRAKLYAWKRGPVEPSHISEVVNDVCSQLRQKLLEFFNALLPFFEEAKADENVVFYLIERQAPINNILQHDKSSIEHLFSHLYPSGPAHLRTILYEGYTRRGFTEFYAQHKTMIESIEWLAEQCPTQVNISN